MHIIVTGCDNRNSVLKQLALLKHKYINNNKWWLTEMWITQIIRANYIFIVGIENDYKLIKLW